MTHRNFSTPKVWAAGMRNITRLLSTPPVRTSLLGVALVATFILAALLFRRIAPAAGITTFVLGFILLILIVLKLNLELGTELRRIERRLDQQQNDLARRRIERHLDQQQSDVATTRTIVEAEQQRLIETRTLLAATRKSHNETRRSLATTAVTSRDVAIDLNKARQAISDTQTRLTQEANRITPLRQALFRDPRLSGDWSYSDFAFAVELFRDYDVSPDRPVFIDVGAQYGVYTGAFLALGWEVIAFEADPNIFRSLENAFGDNVGATLNNLAVSDSSSESVRFYYNSEFDGIGSLRVNHERLSEDRFFEVPCVTLDESIADGSSAVTFLKIDIEGADLPALRAFDAASWNSHTIDRNSSVGHCLI